MFFNEKGILSIDEMVVNSPSFKNIIEDGKVTEEEIKSQSDKVIGMLHELESRCGEEELCIIRELLVESSVLYAIFNMCSIQNLK